MTAIVGVSHAGTVYLGGDSAASDGEVRTVQNEPKVWRAGGILFGACGWLAAVQHFKHVTPWPRYQGQKHEQFLAKQFCPTYRRAIKALRTECGDEHLRTGDLDDRVDGELLIGLGGVLYGIDTSGAYYSAGTAWAIGSGGEAARAVLYHTTGEDPEFRVTSALEAAEAVCLTVREPFTVLSQS